jgi:Spy/CpxP family protein refolding chaperone
MLNPIRSALFAAFVSIALLAMASKTLADAPATKPAAPQAPHISSGTMRPGPAYVIKRLKDAVATLELTDEQKPKVDAVFEQVNKDGLDLSDVLANTPPQQRYPKLIDFSKQIRQQLAGVLTDDQLKSLDEKTAAAFTFHPGNRGPAGAGIADNIQQALDKLDLTDDQKQQIRDVMTQVRQKISDLRQKAQAGDNIQQDIQGVRDFVRDKLKSILSQEQLQSLADQMQQYHPGGRAGRNGGSTAQPPLAEIKPADLESNGPETGSPAPGVQIMQITGRPFSPDKFKGHVVVIEFGSLSCPVFRQHVAEMEKLKTAEGGRAFFLFVYTREAFPAGDKDVLRNKDDGISVTDAKTLDERKAQAIQTQRQLNITMALAVDSMDNAASTAFGTFPNGSVVIGKDGTIAARQQWTNPDTLKLAIDDAVAQPATPVASAH